MPKLFSILRKACLLLVAPCCLYCGALVLFSNGWLQRHALYAHKAQTLWWKDVDEPEVFGFARRQVTPFKISTPDGYGLFAWHILPSRLYAANQNQLGKEPRGIRDSFNETVGYKLLVNDPEARVVIMFHGNAGHVAQAHRPQIYRSLCLSDARVHVLTLDYRGFGRSNGEPSEAGLILDGIALVQFVLSLGIPPQRILILGQSLGTAVSSAVALHFADRHASIELLPDSTKRNDALMQHFRDTTDGISFAAVVLVASFPSLPELLLTYRMAGLIPVLSPLHYLPKLQVMFQSVVIDQWPTAKRLAALVACSVTKGTAELNLKLVHAIDDRDIPWRNGELNWVSVYGALETSASSAGSAAGVKKSGSNEALYTQSSCRDRKGAEPMLRKEERHYGRDGFKITASHDNGRVRAEIEVVKYGGHNEVTVSVPATLAVLDGFRLL